MAHTAAQIELLEYFQPAGKFAIDREAGVISNAKLLGRKSSNRGGTREYTDNALKNAVQLYEGAAVFINHLPDPKDAARVRNQSDHWGEIRNPQVRPDGIYGDIHYLKSHAETLSLLERAERFPNHIGCSQNARGAAEYRNGRELIEEIVQVRSVDIVTRPATTKNLMESHEDTYMATIQQAIAGFSAERRGIASVKTLEAVIAKRPTVGAVQVELTESDSPAAARTVLAMAGVHLMESMTDEQLAKALEYLSGDVPLVESTTTTTPPAALPVPPAATDQTASVLASMQRSMALRDALDRFNLRRADVAPDRIALLESAKDEPAMVAIIESWPAIYRQPSGQRSAGTHSSTPGSKLREILESRDGGDSSGLSYEQLRAQLIPAGK